MRIPILAYEPMHIDGNDYRANDLKALASDLRQIAQAGFRIVPLRTVIDAWLGNRAGELEGKVIALTCDNGADFDYLDLAHPGAGMQRSVLNTLRDFKAEYAAHDAHVTSFVVASPEARGALDAACMIGNGWWTDAWWKAATGTGLMHLGNRSWDHNHESLPPSMWRGVARGTFLSITSTALADHEIRQAAEFLDAHAPNPGTALFSYPYGEVNTFLSRDYFPAYARQMGIEAAFTTRAGFLEPGTSRWEIPRFVCGRDWTSPEELQAILYAADAQRSWIPVRRPTHVQPTPDTPLPLPSESKDAEKFFRARYSMVPRVVNSWVRDHLSLEGTDIMDFGCGEGIAALGLAQNYGPRRVVGVDIGTDPEHCLPVARAHLGLAELPDNLKLHRVVPGCLHDGADRFDLVYSWSVFEHVDERLISGVLKLIKSCLKPNGLFMVQIAPLYYSAEGSHLTHKLAEPWGHLLHQHDVFHEMLRAAVLDEREAEALWGTYCTLNRMTADELIHHVEDAGFEIVRELKHWHSPKPPERLKAIVREEVLTTNEVVLLARCSSSTRSTWRRRWARRSR